MYIMNHELTRIKNSHCERKRSNLKEARDCHAPLLSCFIPTAFLRKQEVGENSKDGGLAMTIALSSALICGNLRPDICV